MNILKIIFTIIGGIICIYCFFRVAALAIANSWKQVMYNKYNACTNCKDHNNQNIKLTTKKEKETKNEEVKK